MSIVLGVYVHVQDGRHRLVWTLIDGNNLIDQGSLGAPTTSEAQRLAELEVRLGDLLTRLAASATPPAGIALRVHDVHGPTDESVRVPAHAEGVILAVAGRLHIKVVPISGQKLGGRQAVAAKVKALQPAPTGDEAAQAAAAAQRAAADFP